MKKSREFDNLLDECLERLLVQGETLEQSLGRYPEQADELRPLLETALAAKKASAIQPRPEFRDRARHQLYSALREMELKRSRSFFSWRRQPRWATTLLAAVLVILLAGSGTVVAASGSMPDGLLYPVKLATERVWLVFTPSALGKAELYARLADRRVLEIAHMAGKSKPEKIELTALRLDTHLTKIADLVSAQPAIASGGGEATPAVEEARVTEEVLVAEEALPMEAASDEESFVIEKAGEAEAVVESEEALVARPALGSSEKPPLLERDRSGERPSAKVDRWIKLRALMLRYAVNHPARLRALLETVPPSARPALLRAIAISETGYQRALQSLN